MAAAATRTKKERTSKKTAASQAKTNGRASSSATTRRRRTKAKPGISREDLAKLVFIGKPSISPDGSRIVFPRKHVGEKNEYLTNLWMADAAGKGEPRQFTSGGKDGAPAWSPDGSTIAFIGGREKRHPQIYTILTEGGEAKKLTSFPEGTISGFRWSPKGDVLAVAFRETGEQRTKKAEDERKEKGLSDPPLVVEHEWYRLDGDGYFGEDRFKLYIVDLKTGEHRLLYDKDTMGWMSFDFSPDGKKLAVTTNRHKRAMLKPELDEIQIIDVRTGKGKAVPGLPKGPKSAVRWSPDGAHLAYAGREDEDGMYSVENLELWICDPSKGDPRCLTGKTDYCLMAVAISDAAEVAFEPMLQWAPDGNSIYMKLGWHGEVHVANVPRRGGEVRMLTSGAYDHEMGNISDDGKRMAMLRGTFDRPAEVYAGEISASAIRTKPLSDFNGELLKERTAVRPTEHWVKTADGTTVHTWVMLPPGEAKSTKKRFPAVLEIHGGPHGQYGVGFFHEFQMLANEGYVVVFTNPRGSKGYGRDHCAAIKGDWGNKDWIDIQAVIEFMQRHPNIDAKRMGVMGGSYGGYMTNWVIGHCNDFAGAITDRCVSNLVSMGGNSDFIDKPDDYFPGNFWDRPEARWEQSPIKYFGNVKTPTLIIHSEGDLRCNIEQSDEVFAALKLRNVPCRYVRYPRSTSHGMSRGGPMDLRQHRLNEIKEWWAKHLKKSR